MNNELSLIDQICEGCSLKFKKIKYSMYIYVHIHIQVVIPIQVVIHIQVVIPNRAAEVISMQTVCRLDLISVHFIAAHDVTSFWDS